MHAVPVRDAQGLPRAIRRDVRRGRAIVELPVVATRVAPGATAAMIAEAVGPTAPAMVIVVRRAVLVVAANQRNAGLTVLPAVATADRSGPIRRGTTAARAPSGDRTAPTTVTTGASGPTHRATTEARAPSVGRIDRTTAMIAASGPTPRATTGAKAPSGVRTTPTTATTVDRSGPTPRATTAAKAPSVVRTGIETAVTLDSDARWVAQRQLEAFAGHRTNAADDRIARHANRVRFRPASRPNPMSRPRRRMWT